ncbi:hypothetical protein BSLA_01r2371 [Burkholderia stabilis]|nr:hypothetical protein BSLA_01r2371 [Burkholderia stabilis]
MSGFIRPLHRPQPASANSTPGIGIPRPPRRLKLEQAQVRKG